MFKKLKEIFSFDDGLLKHSEQLVEEYIQIRYESKRQQSEIQNFASIGDKILFLNIEATVIGYHYISAKVNAVTPSLNIAWVDKNEGLHEFKIDYPTLALCKKINTDH